MSSSTNPNILYEEASQNMENNIDYWGYVPKTYNDAIISTIENFKQNIYSQSPDGLKKLRELKGFLIEWHRSMGISSEKVEKNIELISEGSVLMGQQPVVYGGPGFIGNKFGCLHFLDNLLREYNRPLTPIFFIGDYDGLQKELARAYYPNPISHSAFILDSEDFLPEDSNIAAHKATLPPQIWLEKNLHKLTENLRGFKKAIKGPKKALFDERWDHLKTILRSSFNTSTTLSEWATKIWGTLANISSDLGIVFLPTSHPIIRKLIADQYHRLITGRFEYAKTFLEKTKEIEKRGYKPTLPHRHDDYAPFTLECEVDHNRITTSIVVRGDDLFAEGECPACKQLKSYRVTTPEDIESISSIIGPRVDTSQAVFQDLMNIRLRISGPGEVAYYAQAAPAINKIGFDIPMFVKYKRAFYGKDANEKLGKELEKRKQGTLHKQELFSILRSRMDAIRNENIANIHKAENDMNSFILNQYDLLLKGKQSIDVQKYLGWQFGRFTKHKFGQEVSWAWFDLALQTGASDYIKTYGRMYTKHSLIGSNYFINSSL
ncbi:MAG: bacillithiol biosynthesis protein BshC [Candidatus Kariarchaeaceae archaeon]